MNQDAIEFVKDMAPTRLMSGLDCGDCTGDREVLAEVAYYNCF